MQPYLLLAILNSLTSTPSRLIDYIGFRSQLLSSSHLLFWFLSQNWMLLQKYLRDHIRSSLAVTSQRPLDWQVVFVRRFRTIIGPKLHTSPLVGHLIGML